MHLLIILVAAILIAAFFNRQPSLLGRFLFWFCVPWALFFAIGIWGMLTDKGAP